MTTRVALINFGPGTVEVRKVTVTQMPGEVGLAQYMQTVSDPEAVPPGQVWQGSYVYPGQSFRIDEYVPPAGL